MRFALSLRWFVGLTFLVLALTLVAGYALLSADYFTRGMDNITSLQMEKVAQRYLSEPRGSAAQQPRTYLDYTVYPTWQQVPQTVRQKFQSLEQDGGHPLKPFEKFRDTEQHTIDFLFRYSEGSETVYVTNHVSRETVSAMVRQNSKENRQKLLFISISTALALSLFIWLLLRRISRPISRLVDWTRDLDPNALKKTPPDFTYPELNDLARLIGESLSSVQESLDREHRFLRYTSHELRTPIAVIRNNVELLRKLQVNAQQDGKQQRVIDRLDRASLTAKHLTETLLWLSRDSVDTLPTREIDLSEIINQLAEEMNYLLNDKPVDVVLDTRACRLTLPETVVRIVAGNLIRNAFQHSWEGQIVIRQRGATLEITNPHEASQSEEDQGFGLGLKLTAQLCDKLRWGYDNAADNGIRRASITFSGGA